MAAYLHRVLEDKGRQAIGLNKLIGGDLLALYGRAILASTQ
jgi:hypothetical protein